VLILIVSHIPRLDPHAHSLEDELVYVVSGSGLVWLNGHVQPVHEGDAVGFPAGTGVAHNFINDSNADGTEGEPLILWIIGQNKARDGDLVYYPLHVEGKSKSKRWWAGESYSVALGALLLMIVLQDCPKHDLGKATHQTVSVTRKLNYFPGPHNGRPQRPLNF
jgi:hypothetical protein